MAEWTTVTSKKRQKRELPVSNGFQEYNALISHTISATASTNTLANTSTADNIVLTNKPYTRTSISYGIALIQGNKILTVKSARTYAYGSLIAGSKYYTVSDLTQSFVDSMTLSEKIRILKMISKVNGQFKFNTEYIKRILSACHKKKVSLMSHYKSNQFLHDRYIELKTTLEVIYPMVVQSVESNTHGKLPWSFPKGHRFDEYENPVQVAIRELTEETRIRFDEYIIKQCEPFVIEYVDAGCLYKTVLYLATALSDVVAPIAGSSGTAEQQAEQLEEVSEVRFVSAEELADIGVDPITDEYVAKKIPEIIEYYGKYVIGI